MIELPQWPPPPPPPPARSRRSLIAAAVAVALALVVVVALVNGYRNRSARETADRIGPLSQATRSPIPGVPAPQSPRGGFGLIPQVACPQIRDEQSRLTYRCIDDALRQDGPDVYLGLRISLTQEVEPGWVISQGSGNPQSLASPPSDDTVSWRTATRAGLRANPKPLGPSVPSPDRVRDQVRWRTDLALERGYGDNPSSKVLASHVRSFGGVAGYELLTEITINPAYRARRNLTARVERLWTVGVPTSAGVSIFMLSIPDNRKDLWPKAEATIATVRVL